MGVYFRECKVNSGARKKNRDGILAGFIFTPTLKKIMANAFSGQLQVAISLAIQQYFMLQSTLLECVRY